MSLVALNRMLRRSRRHLVAFAAICTIAGAVAVHHLSMDGMHPGMGDAAMVVCLAVLPALAATALQLAAPSTWRAPRLSRRVAWAGPLLAAPPVPRARSSPVSTVVLRR